MAAWLTSFQQRSVGRSLARGKWQESLGCCVAQMAPVHCSPRSMPLAVWFSCSSHEEVEHISPSLESGWPSDLFWPKACGGHDELSSQKAYLLLFFLLKPCPGAMWTSPGSPVDDEKYATHCACQPRWEPPILQTSERGRPKPPDHGCVSELGHKAEPDPDQQNCLADL